MTPEGPERWSIRPNPVFPVNRGQMCIKGFTAADLLTEPSRLRTPLLRNANGKLVPASWDDALDFVAEKIRALQDAHGVAAMAAFGSGALTNEKVYLLGKFARLVLRTPHLDYNGRYCMSSAAAGQNRAFGIDRGLPFPVEDISETKLLVLWGANPAETMPPLMQWIEAQRANGGTRVVVDPRVTATARDADVHVQPVPGSDLALALGLLYLIIERGLVDEAYVRERTVGFDDVRRSVLGYHPAQVERLTGVSLATMERLVTALGAAESAMILSGRGPEQQSKGADTVVALINVMLALGKVGKPASGYGCLTGQGNGQGGREHGQKADQLVGYRLIEDPEHRAAVAKVWGIDPAELPRKGKSAFELLDSLGPEGGIRGLLVFGSNVAVASPDAGRIGKRLRALDLLVVCDPFLNETAEAAHVVLPVTQWAEEQGTMTNLEGRVVLREPATAPPVGVCSDLEVLVALAARLGWAAAFPSATPADVFAEFGRATAGAKADYSGMTYDRLRTARGLFWPCPASPADQADEAVHPGTPRLFGRSFAFPDGKARFNVVRHRPAAELPDATYSFYFTTGRYKEHYNSGAQTRRVAKLREAQPEPVLEVHPHTGSRLGLVSDGRALVESRRGAVTFRVRLTPTIRPDTVFAPFHWGGREAANVLTIGALDPTSRMPEFKVCAVRIKAA